MGTTAFPGAADDFATTSPTNLGDDDSKGRTHTERHDDMESAMEAVQSWALAVGVTSTWTPAVTGFTQGDGTTSGTYVRIGDLVAFTATFTFGSTSAAASSGVYITLPLSVASASANMVSVRILDSSTSITYMQVGAVDVASDSAYVFKVATDFSWGYFSTTQPFTWATGDSVTASGFYVTDAA